MKYINFLIGKLKQILSIPFILKDYFLFIQAAKRANDKRFSVSIKDFYPCIFDKTKITAFDKHYIYHPAWAARCLAKIQPKEHIDISSILYFSSIISAFIPTKFYDYRPAPLYLDNLETNQADLLNLPFADNSIESLSCMHTVEHIGLGRYGDSIDPCGDLKAINELKRVLVKSGSLLFVVPIGKPKIQFNAHRVYSYEQIINSFSDLKLKEFALISQYKKDKGLIYNQKDLADKEKYGCGCFWFIK